MSLEAHTETFLGGEESKPRLSLAGAWLKFKLRCSLLCMLNNSKSHTVCLADCLKCPNPLRHINIPDGGWSLI